MRAIAETSRVRGSRWGGVRVYWLEEAGDKTASAPKFRKMELELKKIAGLCYATDELLEDATALGSIISQAFPEEFAWEFDDAIIRGNGAGQPLGILNSPALVTVAAQGGQPVDTIVYENIVNMWTRMIASSRGNAAWYINQDIEPQLFTMALVVGAGGVPVYLPANGAAGAPYGTLMGRPVLPIEQASTLGNVGDIMLLDLSQYLWIDKGGIKTNDSIHVRFTNDETVFRFVARVDGQPLWNSPLTPATGSANTLSPFVTLAAR
jgi:HK97 family phage major capsid protein